MANMRRSIGYRLLAIRACALPGCLTAGHRPLKPVLKGVNARKGNRLPHEAGLKLLSVPRAPKELPVTALIRNAHGVAEWKLFLSE